MYAEQIVQGAHHSGLPQAHECDGGPQVYFGMDVKKSATLAEEAAPPPLRIGVRGSPQPPQKRRERQGLLNVQSPLEEAPLGELGA